MWFKRLYLYLTNSCNMKCSYCYQSHDDSDVRLDGKELAEHLGKHYFDQVMLFGGEPTLVDRDYYVDLLGRLKYTVARLATNGALFDETLYADLMSRIRKLEVQISVHTLSAIRPEYARYDNIYYHYTVSASNVRRLADVVLRCHEVGSKVWIGCDRYLSRDVTADLDVELRKICDRIGDDRDFLRVAFLFTKPSAGKNCANAKGEGLLVNCQDGNVYTCSNIMHDQKQAVSSVADLGDAPLPRYQDVKGCSEGCGVSNCRACECNVFGEDAAIHACAFYTRIYTFFRDEARAHDLFLAPIRAGDPRSAIGQRRATAAPRRLSLLDPSRARDAEGAE